MKRKGWETLRDDDEIRLIYRRPDDWHWIIKTTDLVDACGEKNAAAISGNKRHTIMAELYLVPGPTHLNEKETSDVMSMFDGMNIKPSDDHYADMVVEGALDYGKSIHIVTTFAATDKQAIAKIHRIAEIDLDGALEPWFNKIANQLGMTGLELLRGDMDRVFARLKEEQPRTVETAPGAMARRVDQTTMTGECWSVQIWGPDHCRACEFKDKSDCGGKMIRLTGRNANGIIVPVPDAAGLTRKDQTKTIKSGEIDGKPEGRTQGS